MEEAAGVMVIVQVFVFVFASVRDRSAELTGGDMELLNGLWHRLTLEQRRLSQEAARRCAPVYAAVDGQEQTPRRRIGQSTYNALVKCSIQDIVVAPRPTASECRQFAQFDVGQT